MPPSGPPEKKYKCQYCSRAFSRSEHKSRHERSHTKERPFKCMKCRSTFTGDAAGGQRVWKKKGQKRTTRRVMIRPSRAKPKVESQGQGPAGQDGGDDGDDGDGGEAGRHGAPESPLIYEDETATMPRAAGDQPEVQGDSDSARDDHSESAAASSDERGPPSRSRAGSSAAAPTAPARKAGRPVKASAHANYRALKIQRGTRGGGRGRFRRR
ncbi:hypothetical protein KEM52_006348 [Ascosphaera acerosa]|nr:hypothetical protein KEM52_006348 [Ascosphaera acerosa]